MVNKVILQGRVVRDIELQEKGGFKYAEVTVAWSEKIGEVEKKCFLYCKAWRNTAEFLSKFFKKGQEVIIEGQMVTEEWEKDGKKNSRTFCNIERANFCGPKQNTDAPAEQSATSDDFMNVPDTIQEELPFK